MSGSSGTAADANTQQAKKLLSKEFLLLFFQATCCNCFIAVFYCMEQWMARIDIVPATRGILLAVMAIVLFLARPWVTVILYGRRKKEPFIISLFLASLSLLAYPFIPQEHAVSCIFCLRALQGFLLAVYSSCTISMLVDCIPEGENARGFAIFSLTLLIPFAVIPAIGEKLIILVGGETELFAATALLGLCAGLTIPGLSRKLNEQTIEKKERRKNRAQMWQSLRPSNLGLVYFACLTFSIMTNEAIFFMKGLCQTISAVPAYFFTTYTSTIMVIRLVGNRFFDKLPRYPVMLTCAFVLSVCTKMMSTSNDTELIFLSVVYGTGLALLYPLLAALVCDRSTPSVRPLNTNLMMTAFDLSSCLAPVVGGLILQTGYGYEGVFISTSVSIGLCGSALFLDMLIKNWRRQSYSSN